MTIHFRVRRPQPGMDWPPPADATEWPGEEKGKVADDKLEDLMFRAPQAFTDHPVRFIGGPELPKTRK